MKNARGFRLETHRFVEHSQVTLEDLTRVCAMRGLDDLIHSTRVDTGRARGNWQVHEGERSSAYDEGVGAMEGRGELRRIDPLATGMQEIDEASGRNVIWIHNGIPYVGYLEDLDGMLVGAYEALRTWLGRSR